MRRRRPPRRGAPADPLRPRPGWTFTPLPASAEEPAPRYDFRTGIPDARLFPFDSWRRLVAAELRLRANDPARYAAPAGHPALRAAIARYLGYSRSVRAAADDVLITNGTQHALDLIGRVLLRPGDVVAVEEPGYPPARRLFASLGARVVGVPVDDDGLVVDALPGAARVVYTTPSHQFPLGRAMSLARRHALLEWARGRQAAIVEDDYDSEFRFSARPLEPLYSLDTAGRVLYVGTFSKTMLPTRADRVRAGAAGRAARGAGRGPAARRRVRAGRRAGGAGPVHRRGAAGPARAAGRRRRTPTGTPGSSRRCAATTARRRPVRGGAARHGAAAPTARSAAVVAAAAAAGSPWRTWAPTRRVPARPGFVFGFGAIDPALLDEGLAIFGEVLASDRPGDIEHGAGGDDQAEQGGQPVRTSRASTATKATAAPSGGTSRAAAVAARPRCRST